MEVDCERTRMEIKHWFYFYYSEIISILVRLTNTQVNNKAAHNVPHKTPHNVPICVTSHDKCTERGQACRQQRSRVSAIFLQLDMW